MEHDESRSGVGEREKASLSGDVTDLLDAWSRGEPDAEEDLFERIYTTLRRLAAHQLDRGSSTFQLTEIVHETYLRLLSERRVSWQNREQFFAIAARMVRRVVIDHVRRKLAAKRGGGSDRLSLEEPEAALELLELPRPESLVALDQALADLSRDHEQAARIVEMRYFGGMTNEEMASVLQVGRSTVIRRWRFARAWLREALVDVDLSPGAPR